MLDPFHKYKIEAAMRNLNLYMGSAYIFDDKKYDILKELSFEEIIKINFYEIENHVLNLCFKKYYKEEIRIKGIDFFSLYCSISDAKIKQKLLLLAKNNNLDFFVFIIEELKDINVFVENIDEMFKKEISDKLYDPKTKEKLGEDMFLRLIKLYFSNKVYYQDKEKISKLLELENYELLIDLLHGGLYAGICDNVDPDNLNISFLNLTLNSKISILKGYLNCSDRIQMNYYDNLRNCILDEEYNKFYNEHKDTIELFNNLRHENFKNLSLKEQNTLYLYIKNLTLDKKKFIDEEIKKINKEMNDFYRQQYTNIFKKSQSIIEKTTPIAIKDINLKEVIFFKPDYYEDNESSIKKKIEEKYRKHGINKNDSVQVYNLENDEPFEFLITVMLRTARELGINMYGRPSHRLTIDAPENFCKDLNGGSEIISTSMINDRCINTFLGDYADIMYIFSDVDKDDLLTIYPKDAGLSPMIDTTLDLFMDREPMSPKEFMRKTIYNKTYNEISIRRKKITGEKQMPTAILCFDEINSDSIIHAKFFDIPIIVIKTKTYTCLNTYTNYEPSNNKRFH